MGFEGFVDIPGFDGRYRIDRYGNVYSNVSHRIIKSYLSPGGMVTVGLYKNGKDHIRIVATLVAETFIPKKPGDRWVRHKDGDPTNNYVENLEWYSKHINWVQRPVKVKCPNGDIKTFENTIKCSEWFGHKKSWVPDRARRYGNPFTYNGYEITIGDREVRPKS